ncbi:MAG TPA: hypothetical protein VGC77_20410 [Rhodopseudomonas sp.]|uniref:hypothetical protein n=1 Tax=Rhodopseudomonas sp. TaxID=1078 RepID=UPI002ED86462
MAILDFAKARKDINEIMEIVKSVPESLQERCFELLFEAAFAEPTVATAPKEQAQDRIEAPAENDGKTPDKKLPANILAFINRYGVTRAELDKLFMLDHDPMLPVYKIPSGNLSKAQLIKVMMVLLENGLLGNSISAPYTELRESVKDDGFFDSNFNKALKRNHALFRGAITDDSIAEDGVVELTGEGMTKLAEIVKELGQ